MRTKAHSLFKQERGLGVECGSLFLFGFAVFTLFSLLTYHTSDPSFFSNVTGPALNACGRIGAFLSSLFFTSLGLGAFLLPALFGFIAIHVIEQQGWMRTLGTITGMGIATLSLTVFLALQWKYWSFAGSLMLTGGTLGVWFSEMLMKEFNALGSSLVTLVLFFLSLALSTPLSIAQMLGKALKFLGRALWHTTRVLCSYFAFLLGLFVVRIHQKCLDRPIETLASLPAREILINEDLTHSHIPSSHIPDQGPEIVPQDKVLTSNKPQKMGPLKKGAWKLPTLEFLKKPPLIESSIDREKLIQNSLILKQKFLDFGIDGEVTAVRPGPVITLYEFRPGPGIKVSRIAALADDLSMALSAQSVRILAPLPGKSVVGIEIPSESRETVYLREFLQHGDFFNSKHSIPIVMGKDIGGQVVLSDLARMPHLLCAGQTGSGKSVFMNGLICSLFYRFTPDELRMILVDPKFIEFRAYQDIPHLLLPVVDDPKQAATAMKWAVREMDRRYRILAMMGARNLAGFNQKVEEMGTDVIHDLLFSEENQTDQLAQLSGADWIEAFEPDSNGVPRIGKLPYIVIIIDELADLMMVAKKEVELSIARIAQKARAAGIHLIAATQRPSTDVITGLIKANLPSRVSFQLASYADSKTILDRSGAERLVGQGDMLFAPPGMSQLIRLHGPYVDDDEIHKIASFLKSQGKPVYRDEILLDTEDEDADWNSDSQGGDELYDQAVELVKRTGHASASFLQRHLKIGYNRAARMIETMEARGMVSPAEGSKPREILLR